MATTKRVGAAKGAPRLKNYRSQATEDAIFSAIRKELAGHLAKRIRFDQDDAGNAIAIEFSIEASGGGRYTFRLPARFEQAGPLVAASLKAGGRGTSEEAVKDQAYRTVWATIRDWISAQMALIDIGAVQPEEVYERFAEQRALPSPRMTIREEK